SCRPTTPSTRRSPRRTCRASPRSSTDAGSARRTPGRASRTARSGRRDMAFVADSADVAANAKLGEGTKIWHQAQVREDAQLGVNCIVGRGAYVGTGVRVGDNCKIQNLALVYEPAELADGVFIGPAVVLTNDTYPRAINADGSQKSAAD